MIYEFAMNKISFWLRLRKGATERLFGLDE